MIRVVVALYVLGASIIAIGTIVDGPDTILLGTGIALAGTGLALIAVVDTIRVKTRRCGRCGAKTDGKHAIGFRRSRWARIHTIELCEDCTVSYYMWYGSGKSQNGVFCDKSPGGKA